MIYIRKILSFLVGFILMNLVGLLFISFVFKDVVQNNLIGGIVKESLIPVVAEKTNLTEKEKIEEIFNNSEVTNKINDIISDMIVSIGNDNEINNAEIDKIFDYLIENEEIVKTVSDNKVNSNDLIRLKNSNEYKETSEKIVNSFNKTTKELGEFEKSVIKIYGFLISDTFKYVVIALIIVSILLLMLIEWSLINWINILSIDVIICGLFLVILYFVFNILISKVAEIENIRISVDSSIFIITGIIYIVVGIILKRIFNKLNKKYTS